MNSTNPHLARHLRLLTRQRAWFCRLDGGRRNNCITSTKIVCETLRLLGHRAEPLPVAVTLYNPPHAAPMIAYEREHGRLPEPELIARWATEHVEAGNDPAWKQIVIGLPVEGRGWSGHLIARVDDVVVDFTIDQCSRPEYGVVIDEPLVIPSGGVALAAGCSMVAESACGCLLVYGPHPVPELADGWRQSDAWNERCDRFTAELALAISRGVDPRIHRAAIRAAASKGVSRC